MARKQLTKAQIAARTAKAKATKEANKQAALQMLGIEPTKSVKIRAGRNLSDEQKAAAAARLRKARENKAPSENTLIDENVRNLPDDHKFSLKNVRQWIKENKLYLQGIKALRDSKDSTERAHYQKIETYIANLETYLRSGVYLDNAYGPDMQNKIMYRVTHMAYNKDGTPKRTIGFWYPDIGLYTQEMADNG